MNSKEQAINAAYSIMEGNMEPSTQSQIEGALADIYDAMVPFIAAQAKGEALAEIANDYMGEFPFMREVWYGPTHPASNAAREIATKTLKWLRARAEE